MLEDRRIYTADVLQRMIKTVQNDPLARLYDGKMSDDEILLCIAQDSGKIYYPILFRLFEKPPFDLVAAAARFNQISALEDQDYDFYLTAVNNGAKLRIVPTKFLDDRMYDVAKRMR